MVEKDTGSKQAMPVSQRNNTEANYTCAFPVEWVKMAVRSVAVQWNIYITVHIFFTEGKLRMKTLFRNGLLHYSWELTYWYSDFMTEIAIHRAIMEQ